MSYLALAKDLAARLDLAGPSVLEPAEEIGAVLIRSPRFGEVWVALDPSLIDELASEERARPRPRPVLSAADLALLAGKPEAMLRAVLKVAATFPGTWVLQ